MLIAYHWRKKLKKILKKRAAKAKRDANAKSKTGSGFGGYNKSKTSVGASTI